jgi:H/ACA ribonucleoprotein complex subunit 3
MTGSILRVCRSCEQYSFRLKCPKCSGLTQTPHPARFDPGDRYGKYRRMLLDSLRASPGPR